MQLVDMHGNKGSIDGDSAAAMRYTEARLGPITKYLLTNLEKNTVSFAPNFDDSELEPTVLPAQYPNIIVNGATGIAAGYATNIPPHNLNEVIEALKFVHENESVKLSDLTNIVKGPDFPTGGLIQDKKSIREAYKTGKGRIVIRSKTRIDEKNSEIIISEIPFETNKAEIVKKIDDLIQDNKITGLLEVRDDTDRTGLQITLKLKDVAKADLILNYLYKNTNLQKSYSFNMVAIVDRKPQLMNLQEILSAFKSFQVDTYKKLYTFELNKLDKRLEIVEGLIKVVDVIDSVISIIRKSTGKADAKAKIIKAHNFTDRQAEAIVTLRLYRLSSTDINELTEEKAILEKEITHFSKGLKDKKYLTKQIISGLDQIQDEFQIKRKSKITASFEEVIFEESDLIDEEQVQVVVTQQGLIKRVSLKSRNSAAPETIGRNSDDNIVISEEVSNMKNLVLFCNTGRYYSFPIYKLKEFRFKDKGIHISDITSADGLTKIVGAAFIDNFEMNGTLITSTKNGMIKQSLLTNFSHELTKRGGLFAKMKTDDEVVSVMYGSSQLMDQVTLTRKGIALKFPIKEIPIIGMTGSGVKNISLKDDDKVISTIVGTPDSFEKGKTLMSVFTSNGKAKNINFSKLKYAGRGTKGSAGIKQSKSSPANVVSAFKFDSTRPIFVLTTNFDLKINPAKSLDNGEYNTSLVSYEKDGISTAMSNSLVDIKISTKAPKAKKSEKEEINVNNILDDL
ncbi:MAG: DNA gyrase subunit A [Tenericutes bacterium]|nr:MAG: DNA gyrase subunit A [Mycoplasmatota bacterium]